MTEAGASFNGIEKRKDRKNPEAQINRLATGSIVLAEAGSTVVIGQDIDIQPHDWAQYIHTNILLKASPKGERPKDVKDPKIKEALGDHEPIFEEDKK